MFAIVLASYLVSAVGDAAADAAIVQQAARTAAYYDPGRRGEGLFVESLGGDRALVYFLSYATRRYWDPWWGPYESIPLPAWMIGLGRYQGDLLVADMVMPTGGHFGTAFDPDQIDYLPFGSLIFQFPTCATSEIHGSLEIRPIDRAALDYEVFDNPGTYVQLSQVIDCGTGIEKASSQFDNTGSWYDPSRPGEGLVVEVLENNRAIVLWMTYDNEGNQMWLQGMGDIDPDAGYNGLLTIDDMWIFSGSYWGSEFNAADVTARQFGTISLDFYICIYANMTYDSPEFGSGTLRLTRLTWPMNVNPGGSTCWDY